MVVVRSVVTPVNMSSCPSSSCEHPAAVHDTYYYSVEISVIILEFNVVGPQVNVV